MSDFSKIDVDEAEIVRIISKMPEFGYLLTLKEGEIRHVITHDITPILCEYYLENTRGRKALWTSKFAEAGITEDDGKAVISRARRLGIDIS
ncbi:MAG: hypothetical protein WAO91_07370 [Candidatus Nitrosotenuis sp.]